jgi:HAD superfamily hydrolase (TIGR01490 family)
MNENKTLVFFDFDGTITKKDVFVDFVKYRLKNGLPVFKAISCIPVLLLYFLRIINNQSAKERIFSKLFREELVIDFSAWVTRYSITSLPGLIRKDALQQIESHKNQGHIVNIVSANFDLLLNDFATNYDLNLICTPLIKENGLITGRFAKPNCYGNEKVIRVRECFPDLDTYQVIYTYGDSNGDKPLLAISTHKFYRHFKG